VRTCNPRTWEMKAGGLGVCGQPGLYRRLCLKTKTKQNIFLKHEKKESKALTRRSIKLTAILSL
jgi:hypothetical protein